MIPSAMLYVKGIIIIVRKAGIASVKSSKFTSLIGDIMNNPTITRTGAVAALGIIRNRGDRKRATKKRMAVVKAVSPVFPPSATPEALSTYVVTVLVPRHAPTVVPTASANRAALTLGILPSLSTRPAFVETPIRVPTVSNMSTKRNVNRMISISIEKTWEKSNLKIIGARDGGAQLPEGAWVMPMGNPTRVVMIIPRSKAPLTLKTSRMPVTTMPIIARSPAPPVTFPSATIVPSPLTIIPALTRPINAINSPIPTDIAFLILGVLN